MRFSHIIFLLIALLTGCGGAENSNTSTTNTASNSNATNTTANTNAQTAAKLPEFPWPPDASAFTSIPSEKLVKQDGGAKLSDADASLRRALGKAGYETLGYYHVPGGFVVVTQLEQFDAATGAPLAGANRWSTSNVPPKIFTREYFRALIKGNSGHYRVIAFAVTNVPITQTGKEVSASQAGGLAPGGGNALPVDIKEQAYTPDYQCTAMIYEFLQPNSGQAQFVHSSSLQPSQHLQKILPFLEQPL